MNKKIFCFILSLFMVISMFANVKKDNIGNSQKAYRDALFYFDQGDYGKSLKFAEDAVLFQKKQIDYEVAIVKDSLSSRAFQSAGDNIIDILNILEERKEQEVIRIVNYYVNKKGIDFFDNSIDNLLTYISSLSAFPEAQKLIGDIYKLEGEYEIAQQYYEMALSNSEVLDIPDEKYEILYLLAEISEFLKDYDSYELRLLNIVGNDENFKNKTLKDAMIYTIKSNNKSSIAKFFSLYRADSYICLNAYIKLANYYFEIGELDRALEFSALSVITSFTKISESLESRNNEYKTSSLELFFQECALYSDIIVWGSDNEVWKCFNSFARILIAKEYKEFAKELLIILSKNLPDSYWQQDAVLLLSNL